MEIIIYFNLNTLVLQVTMGIMPCHVYNLNTSSNETYISPENSVINVMSFDVKVKRFSPLKKRNSSAIVEPK